MSRRRNKNVHVDNPALRPTGSGTEERRPGFSPVLIHTVALVGIVLVASFLRLNQLATVPSGLFPDEAMEGSNALEALETHEFKEFYPENNGREGMYVNLAAVAIRIFGPTKLALRLPAAVFGIGTIIGLYCLATELFQPAVGILAALFLATSFWHVVASRLAGHAILAPFFLTWAIFLLISGARLGNNRRARAFIIAGGLLYGLGFYTYISYRITPLLIIVVFTLWWCVHSPRVAAGRVFLLFFFPAALISLPLFHYFAKHPETFWQRARQVSIINSSQPALTLLTNIGKTIGMLVWRGDSNWRHNYSGQPQLFWPIALLFICGLIALIQDFDQHRRKGRWNSHHLLQQALTTGWLVVGAIPALMAVEVPHALRSIIIAPPIFIIAGIGGSRVLDLMKSPRVTTQGGAGVLCLAALTFQAYNMYFDVWARSPEVPRHFMASLEDIADHINRLPNQTPKYVVVATEAAPVRAVSLIAQPIMYLTDSFTARGQRAHNIQYITPTNAKDYGASPGSMRSLCDQIEERQPYVELFCIE